MQTSAAAVRISNASHGTNIQLNTQNNQIVIQDTRLFNWQLASSGGLTYAYPVRAVLNSLSELLRVRTLSNNTLEIVYATPADTVTWSSNTITANAKAGTGVDLYQSGATVDAFWYDSDGITIKTARSTDSGHTWGASSTVATLPAQGTGVLPQLCAPMADTLIYSDSTVGADPSGNPLTGLYITTRNGTWSTPQLWLLGGQPLGIEAPVTLPNGVTYPSNLSGIALDSSRAELCWYGDDPRDAFEAGLWLQRIANIDTSLATQNLHWSNPEILFGTVPLDDDNNNSQIWCAFPRLQVVGTEYWVVALECSLFAGVEKYHLAFFRADQNSRNWSRWSDREYRQGATPNADEQVGAYCYGGNQPFQYTDLIYANLVVTDARTFIVGYDKLFYCASTVLVGVNNPAKALDITPYTTDRSLDLSTSPGSGQGSYVIKNPANLFNQSQLLASHRGIRLLDKAGYVTTSGQELLQLAIEYLDSVNQETPLGDNVIRLNTVDGMSLLNRTKMDLFWEWFGSQQIAYTQFCDLSMLNVIQGNYITTRSGRLVSGVVRQSDNFRDNIGVFTNEPANGGTLECLFKCVQTWGGTRKPTWNHVGIAFQGKAGEVDQFWAVLYNKKRGKFSLHQAVPRTDPNQRKLYRYRAAVAESSAIPLNAGRRYWLRVSEWQGHVMAWYTTDTNGTPDPNWINVIDYTSPASPASDVLPARTDWWGLIGTRRVSPSGAIGNLSGSAGPVALSNGTAPRYFALRVHTGAYRSTLKRINVVFTQENTNGTPMPSVNIMLVTGSASAPDDISDEENIIYAQDISSLHFSNHNRPNWVYGSARPNPGLPRLLADTYYWIVAVLQDDLQTGQSYNFWSDNTGTYGTDTTRYSDDGTTWTGMGSVNMAGSIEVDYDAGMVKFVAARFVSGDRMNTLEDLSCSLAAKGGILDSDTDDWVNEADLTLGADDILWQPEEYGVLADFVMDATVTPGATAEWVFGSDAIDSGDNYYRIVLDPSAQTISCYGTGASLIGATETLNYIPTGSFQLRFGVQQGFAIVFINETLAGSFWVGTVDETTGILTSPTGYIGLVNGTTTWSTMRVPDLYQTVDYVVLNANSTPEQTLSDMLTKPAVGSAQLARYFINYDGKFRISTFRRQTSSDTYHRTLLKPTRGQNAQYVVSEVDPQGNYYARRVDGAILATEGRWYDQVDYTNARTDRDAYADAAAIFRSVAEKSDQYSLETAANFAIEREDRITIVNPRDGTSGDYVVNDIKFAFPQISSGQILPKQTLGLRKAVD